MSLKDTLNGLLDAGYEKTVNKLGEVFAAAELLVDEILPDGSDDEPTVAQKAEVLAQVCDAEGEVGAVAAANYRAGVVADGIVNSLYRALVAANPSAAVKSEDTSSPVNVEKYIAYLKANFPTMAKVYEQSIRDQAKNDNGGFAGEVDDDPWFKDGKRNT